MNKSNKVLMTAVAGLTATQPIASSMTVFAADNDKAPAPAETNTKKAVKTEQEVLESKLFDTKKTMEDKKIAVDSAKGASSVASKQVEIVQAAYDARDTSVKQNYQATYDAIMNELQPILNEIESLETQINDSKKELEEQTTLNEQASANLEQAQKDLDAKKTELADLQNKLASLGD